MCIRLLKPTMEVLSEEVVCKINENGLTLQDLVSLTPEEIKELAPRIKDRLELRNLIAKCKVGVSSYNRSPYSNITYWDPYICRWDVILVCGSFLYVYVHVVKCVCVCVCCVLWILGQSFVLSCFNVDCWTSSATQYNLREQNNCVVIKTDFVWPLWTHSHQLLAVYLFISADTVDIAVLTTVLKLEAKWIGRIVAIKEVSTDGQAQNSCCTQPEKHWA